MAVAVAETAARPRAYRSRVRWSASEAPLLVCWGMRRHLAFFLAAAVGAACTGGDGPAPATTTTATNWTTTTGSGGTVTTGSGGQEPVPDMFIATGVVVDGEGQPVDQAVVLQGGHAIAMVTGADGAFSIDMTNANEGVPTVVAAKVGYRSGGFEYEHGPIEPVTLVMYAVPPFDNPGYVYPAPGFDMMAPTSECAHCHAVFVQQFHTSAHARAASDPLVQDLYAGVTGAHTTQASCEAAGGRWLSGLVPGVLGASDKCYLGGGVLPDLNPSCGGPASLACDDPALPAAQRPTAFGACADCHAPGIDGVAGGHDLHEATGTSFNEGVHCDTCHKVSDIDLGKPAGVAGRLVIRRPSDTITGLPGAPLRAVQFGSFPDVPLAFMGGSYQPKFAESVYCAGCHQQRQPALVPGESLDAQRWPDGLPVHDTYEEAATGPLSGMRCQNCHMPPDPVLASSFDDTTPDNAGIIGGFLRPAGTVRQHTFVAPLDGSPRLVDSALGLSVQASSDGTSVAVDVTVVNGGAAHAVPSGEPMRAVLLLVDVEGCATTFAPNGGMTVLDTGGLRAMGVAGTSVTVAGPVLSWPAGAAVAAQGDRVRVVRASGVFDDYTGVGFFAGPGLTPAEKGREIWTPVGEAAVQSVSASSIMLASTLAIQPGDRVYLGDDAGLVADGAGARALAGAAGYDFAKVLVDSVGTRHVAHYRAVDIASDNRIAPAGSALTQHSFAVAAGCTSATVRARLVYRPVPYGLGKERGWQPKDYVIGESSQPLTIP